MATDKRKKASSVSTVSSHSNKSSMSKTNVVDKKNIRNHESKGTGVSINLPIEAEEFLIKVTTLLETEESRAKLFTLLQNYHENRKIKNMINELKSLLDNEKKKTLFKDIRAMVSPEHLSIYDKYADASRNGERFVRIKKNGNETLGFTFRGGKEHGIGFYVTSVNDGSVADIAGLKSADEIRKINGLPLHESIHDEVAAILKRNPVVTLLVKNSGRVPSKLDNRIVWHEIETDTDETNNGNENNIKSLNDNDNFKSTNDNLSPIHKIKKDRLLAFRIGESGLGCSIRTGIRGHKGVYVTAIAKDSLAEQLGLKIGDQILDVSGKSFMLITHDQAVEFLRGKTNLTMIVRHNKIVEEIVIRRSKKTLIEKEGSRSILRKGEMKRASIKKRASFNSEIQVTEIEPFDIDEDDFEDSDIESAVIPSHSNYEYSDDITEGREVHYILIPKTSKLGLDVEQRGGRMFVKALRKNGAAASHGFIQQGDLLLNVEGDELSGKTVDETKECIKKAMERWSKYIEFIVACEPGRVADEFPTKKSTSEVIKGSKDLAIDVIDNTDSSYKNRNEAHDFTTSDDFKRAHDEGPPIMMNKQKVSTFKEKIMNSKEDDAIASEDYIESSEEITSESSNDKLIHLDITESESEIESPFVRNRYSNNKIESTVYGDSNSPYNDESRLSDQDSGRESVKSMNGSYDGDTNDEVVKPIPSPRKNSQSKTSSIESNTLFYSPVKESRESIIASTANIYETKTIEAKHEPLVKSFEPPPPKNELISEGRGKFSELIKKFSASSLPNKTTPEYLSNKKKKFSLESIAGKFLNRGLSKSKESLSGSAGNLSNEENRKADMTRKPSLKRSDSTLSLLEQVTAKTEIESDILHRSKEGQFETMFVKKDDLTMSSISKDRELSIKQQFSSSPSAKNSPSNQDSLITKDRSPSIFDKKTPTDVILAESSVRLTKYAEEASYSPLSDNSPVNKPIPSPRKNGGSVKVKDSIKSPVPSPRKKSITKSTVDDLNKSFETNIDTLGTSNNTEDRYSTISRASAKTLNSSYNRATGTLEPAPLDDVMWPLDESMEPLGNSLSQRKGLFGGYNSLFAQANRKDNNKPGLTTIIESPSSSVRTSSIASPASTQDSMKRISRSLSSNDSNASSNTSSPSNKTYSVNESPAGEAPNLFYKQTSASIEAESHLDLVKSENSSNKMNKPDKPKTSTDIWRESQATFNENMQQPKIKSTRSKSVDQTLTDESEKTFVSPRTRQQSLVRTQSLVEFETQVHFAKVLAPAAVLKRKEMEGSSKKLSSTDDKPKPPPPNRKSSLRSFSSSETSLDKIDEDTKLKSDKRSNSEQLLNKSSKSNGSSTIKNNNFLIDDNKGTGNNNNKTSKFSYGNNSSIDNNNIKNKEYITIGNTNNSQNKNNANNSFTRNNNNNQPVIEPSIQIDVAHVQNNTASNIDIASPSLELTSQAGLVNNSPFLRRKEGKHFVNEKNEPLLRPRINLYGPVHDFIYDRYGDDQPESEVDNVSLDERDNKDPNPLVSMDVADKKPKKQKKVVKQNNFTSPQKLQDETLLKLAHKDNDSPIKTVKARFVRANSNNSTNKGTTEKKIGPPVSPKKGNKQQLGHEEVKEKKIGPPVSPRKDTMRPLSHDEIMNISKNFNKLQEKKTDYSDETTVDNTFNKTIADNQPIKSLAFNTQPIKSVAFDNQPIKKVNFDNQPIKSSNSNPGSFKRAIKSILVKGKRGSPKKVQFSDVVSVGHVASIHDDYSSPTITTSTQPMNAEYGDDFTVSSPETVSLSSFDDEMFQSPTKERKSFLKKAKDKILPLKLNRRDSDIPSSMDENIIFAPMLTSQANTSFDGMVAQSGFKLHGGYDKVSAENVITKRQSPMILDSGESSPIIDQRDAEREDRIRRRQSGKLSTVSNAIDIYPAY